MPEDKYKVIVDSAVIASNMELDIACSFAQFLFEKWYAEPALKITIEKCDNRVKGARKEVTDNAG